MKHGDAELALLPDELGVVVSSKSLGVVVEPLLGLGDEDVNRPIASGHRDSLPPAVPALRHFL